MHQFYVVLPSDSSMDYFPDNTVATFTTKLSERIVLDGEYEVALTEILYPITYNNFVLEDRMVITYTPRNGKSMSYWVHDGYFKNEVDFLNSINKEMKENGENLIEFHFNENTKRVYFKCPQGRITFSTEAALRLGYSGRTNYDGDITCTEQWADVEFDLVKNTRLMYVYCDVASYNYVGDVKTPLLRVFNTDGTRGDMATKTFHQPMYVPVNRNEFETIHIKICNELGMPVQFTSGKVVATLHFKRV